MRKEEKTQITKDKLIANTEKLIEQCEDPYKVTSRQIAAASGVQPAMINYCFGSRENLIHEVFERKYKSTLSDPIVNEIVSSNSITPKEKLKRLHFIVARFLINDFKYTKAITKFVLFNRDLSRDSFSSKYVIEHYKGTKTNEECKLIAYELSTMMQLIIFRCQDLKNGMNINLEDENVLKHYIDLRVDLLLEDVD
ncbi:MAG: TetR/AcrR family transcriptional regulator [Saccharofermentans sp.]|nr:TetR/AcrR family transcriptional regulator [Saccharofermentans sp.]